MSLPLAVVETSEATLVFEDDVKQKRFELGTCMALYSWDDLTTAVESQWGGADSADKRDWMVGAVVELFEQNYVDSDDIEDRILGIMEDEFGVDIEDSSSAAVAVKIITLYKECAEGNFETVDKLYKEWQEREAKRVPGASRVNVTVQGSDSDSDDDDDDEDNDNDDITTSNEMDVEPKPEKQGPIIDDDGFELVQRKKR
jgi:pre-rRNA-processing protein TSR2